ncbi:MAG: hypothetical protein ABFD50_15105 [Smithella sp.]
MSYVIYREKEGVKEYLTEDRTFTRDRLKAKEWVGFVIEILKILISLLGLFGTNLKITKK